MSRQEFAELVLRMRMKQQEYFRVAMEAKRDPAKHTLRKKVLEESKHLEAEVDENIVFILNPSARR